MDKLRKIGKWIWCIKERLVLLIMMVLLGYRVYVVINPPQLDTLPPVRPPRKEVPQEQRPPMPPPPPVLDVPTSYSALYNNNPFWFYSGQSKQGATDEITPERLGIALKKIKQVNDSWKAQLSTESTTRWYDEGDKFEAFELQQINPEDGTVVVYVESYAKEFTLALP